MAAGSLLLGLLPALSARSSGEPPADIGAAIYLRGILSSGAPLQGMRAGGGGLNAGGADAACVSCHQRSGLGAVEGGNVTIPPIAGRYLFQPSIAARNQADLPYVGTVRTRRAPYTEATLARAIRTGVDSDGKTLGPLMPRFALSDADLTALIGYLNALDPQRVPGATDTLLHFATIITPDTDPAQRRGMLDVLNQFFADKNAFPLRPSPQMRTSGKGIYAKSMYKANRHWQLHVWQLTGPDATWREQLERHLAEEPVMAVISGLGVGDWSPIHDFCERERLPCLFPNIEAPAFAPGDFYSLYFSKGVLLEADLIANAIGQTDAARKPKSVLQVYRAGDSGAAAARALAADLQRRGIAVKVRVLPQNPPGSGLAGMPREASSADVLVLWLRAADLAALPAAADAPPIVYASGLMGGLEAAPLPASWRRVTRLSYPYDLPERRIQRVDYPLVWFKSRHIAVVAETMQADTYLACGMLSETLNHTADIFNRAYLIETLEQDLEHRYLTGYFPRLELAPGQNFASKGGYIVKFAEPSGTKLVPEGGWTAP